MRRSDEVGVGATDARGYDGPDPPEPTVFLIRRARVEDVPTLLKLARMVHFINLPADKDIITEKVQWSRRCFADLAARGVKGRGTPDKGESGNAADGVSKLHSRAKLFMFVLEDTESRGVLGTSQIITSVGGKGQPNLSFELKRKEMFSTSLQMGVTHVVAQLKLDETGPTEIGGLILQPSYRGHKARLGRFLSSVRFHFMGLHRGVVADRVLAEMMGPITPDGHSTLWEYLGRRFINLTYIEADRFCQHSREFMLNLLPREEIYLTLLPPEARRLVAQVGPETEPAKKMLERLGFEYRNCIDPFDGGPNLEARTDDIELVKLTRRNVVGPPLSEDGPTPLIVSAMDDDGEFIAIQAMALEDAKQGVVRLSRPVMDAIGVKPGDRVGVTRLADTRAPSSRGRSAGAISNGLVEHSGEATAPMGKRGRRAKGGS